MTPRSGAHLRRIAAGLGAVTLLAALLPLMASARAAVPLATVPVACANVVSSTTVYLNDIVSFGPAPSGCTVVSNSSSGNLDRVSANGFVAFAVGSGTMLELLNDGSQDYLNQVNVTILPQPSPTPTGTASPSPGATTPSTDASATPSASAAPTDPPFLAPPDRPQPQQRLTGKQVTAAGGLEPGQVAFFGPDGMPLQLLSMTGATGGITVIDDGINYSTVPANWQRLSYGDTCWSYAGYGGTQGFVLPVATPPFDTVPANWILTAAIVGTATGNVTFREPAPGQVVDAGGRDIATLTLCAQGYPNAITSTSARTALRAAPADKGGGQYQWVPGCSNGQATGNRHCTGTTTWPSVSGPLGPQPPIPTPKPTSSPKPTATPKPSSTPTASPSASTTPKPTASATPDDLLPVCRATTDPERPYRRVLVPTSQIAPTGGDRLYPTAGWTDILPPTAKFSAGQNWPAGASLLFDANCAVTFVRPEPVQPITGYAPVPQPTTGPGFTGTSPAIVVTPLPQPSFTGYGPITPWPPLQPVPLKGTSQGPGGQTSLTPPLPSPMATPTPVPTLTPTPSPVATPSLVATPTPSPTATPTPTTTVTPIPQPTFVGFGPVCGSGPCLVTPVIPPTKPYTALVSLTPASTTGGTPDAPRAGTVTFVLTNGPSTVTYTTTTASLLTVATPTSGSSTKPTKPVKPSTVSAGRSRR